MKLNPLCLAFLLGASILAGCNSSTGTTSPPSPADEVKTIVALDPSADPGYAGYDGTDAILVSASLETRDPSALQFGQAASDTCWLRHLQTSNATLSASGDTSSMLVTLTRVNTGVLNVGGCPSPAVGPYFTKNYTVTWTRSGTYSKGATVDPNSGEDNATAVTRWRLVGATLPHSVLGAGDPVIDSVWIGHPDFTNGRTYTDPEAMEDPATWPQYSIGDALLVRLYTHSPDPVMAFVHFDVSSGLHPRLQRQRMQYDAVSGSYQGTLTVQHGYFLGRGRGWRVRQALWVDLVTRATLRDSGAGYAASGWGVPYRLQHPTSAPWTAMR